MGRAAGPCPSSAVVERCGQNKSAKNQQKKPNRTHKFDKTRPASRVDQNFLVNGSRRPNMSITTNDKKFLSIFMVKMDTPGEISLAATSELLSLAGRRIDVEPSRALSTIDGPDFLLSLVHKGFIG